MFENKEKESLRTGTLQFFFELLHKESGLVLDASKQYLIETRLAPIAIQEGFSSIEGLCRKLMQNDNPFLKEKVVDAMTTNETSFFRDQTPFLHLKDDVLPALLKRKAADKRIRIWSAASSSGQEPYSIALLLCDIASDLSGWEIEVIATDISERILNKARLGIYSQYEVQRGLSVSYLERYFDKTNGAWRIKDKVKAFVSFKKVNLLSDFSSIGIVDVIFCRNILIYFDKSTKSCVLQRMMKRLAPSGYLFLGGAETLLGFESQFDCNGNKGGHYYRKK